jgi:hypothetical protein
MMIAGFQSAHRLDNLLTSRVADDGTGAVIHGDHANFPDGANPRAREKYRDNPKVQVVDHEPTRCAAQTTERIVLHDVGIGGLARSLDSFGRALRRVRVVWFF